MSSTRDFVAATFADALLPMMRRPVEDVIYETIDRRQMPTRTDFTEIRDLVNSLRGQLTGATGGVKRLAETVEDLDDRLGELEEKLQKVDALLGSEDAPTAPNEALQARLAAAEATVAALEARLAQTEALEARVEALAAQMANATAAPSVAPSAPAQKTVRICRVPGCTSPARARGLCARHYQQLRRGTLTEADLS